MADAGPLGPALRAMAATIGAGAAAVTGEATRADEHRNGRRAATAAVAATASAIAALPDDAPSPWPPGVTGSISHHAGTALAVALPDPTGRVGIGVDVDGLGRLPADDAAFVLDERERAAAAAAGVDVMVPWAVKEAAFKAVSNATPGGRRDLDPRAVHVTVTADGIAAVVLGAEAGTVTPMTARWCVVASSVLAIVVVVRGEP